MKLKRFPCFRQSEKLSTNALSVYCKKVSDASCNTVFINYKLFINRGPISLQNLIRPVRVQTYVPHGTFLFFISLELFSCKKSPPQQPEDF